MFYSTIAGTVCIMQYYNICLGFFSGRGFYWAIHPNCLEDFQQGDFNRRHNGKRDPPPTNLAQDPVRKKICIRPPDAHDDSVSPDRDASLMIPVLPPLNLSTDITAKAVLGSPCIVQPEQSPLPSVQSPALSSTCTPSPLSIRQPETHLGNGNHATIGLAQQTQCHDSTATTLFSSSHTSWIPPTPLAMLHSSHSQAASPIIPHTSSPGSSSQTPSPPMAISMPLPSNGSSYGSSPSHSGSQGSVGYPSNTPGYPYHGYSYSDNSFVEGCRPPQNLYSEQAQMLSASWNNVYQGQDHTEKNSGHQRHCYGYSLPWNIGDYGQLQQQQCAGFHSYQEYFQPMSAPYTYSGIYGYNDYGNNTSVDQWTMVTDKLCSSVLSV